MVAVNPSVTSAILPATTSLSVSAGATVNLAGNNQSVASLANYAAGSGGTVVNSSTAFASTLSLNTTGGTSTFSGVIAGGSGLGTINLVLSGSGTRCWPARIPTPAAPRSTAAI